MFDPFLLDVLLMEKTGNYATFSMSKMFVKVYPWNSDILSTGAGN